MRLEIPDCRRCCWCIPSRYGIIIYGYLNLLFTLFLIFLETWVTLRTKDENVTVTSLTLIMYKGVTFFTQVWLPVLLYGFEVVFNILLLIGAHMKQERLIRAYYYYGITTTLAAFITFVAVKSQNYHHGWDVHLSDLCLAFCGLVLQIYLLLLIRTELSKQRYQDGRLTYVNHMSEVAVHQPLADHARNPF